MSLGGRLAEERKRLGFAQGDFARRAGVSVSTQKRYEIGEREPGTSFLENVRALGVDVGYVLTGKSARGEGTGLDSHELAEFGLAVIKYLNIDPSDVMLILREAEKAVKAELFGTDELGSANAEADRFLDAFEQYFFVHASAFLRQHIDKRSTQEAIDSGLLAESIEQVAEAAKRLGEPFSASRQARLAALSYKLVKQTGGRVAEIVGDIVALSDQN